MKRAAIIGCGTIFPVHLAAILSNPEISLCAVCDIDPSVREKLPPEVRDIPFYTDYQELLKQQRPDVAHICLPHYLHVPVSEYFAEHGVDVFCEKPVGLNRRQGQEFAAFEAAHPERRICICLQNRLNRTTIELKKLLDSGVYGQVIGCRGVVPWNRTKAYYDAQPWRGRLETAGGGCMINQSVHTLDLLYYLCGEIRSVHGSVSQLADFGIEVEDTVSARLEFASGVQGMFMATNCNYTNESVQIKIACEKASFLIENDALFRIDPDGTYTRICENEKMPGAKFYFGASHRTLIAEFYRALENDTDDYIHVKDAEMSIRLIDAILESSRKGCTVTP